MTSKCTHSTAGRYRWRSQADHEQCGDSFFDTIIGEESRVLLAVNLVKIEVSIKNSLASFLKLIFILLTAPLTLQILHVIFHCVILEARNVQRASHACVQDLS